MFAAIKSPKFISLLKQQAKYIHNCARIGNRDWVDFGVNGSANYQDTPLFPFPAVRFKENTEDICALREREKCDWRMLCIEEKKALYRASFCQTYAEFQHPTGQWKAIIGIAFICFSFPFWVMMFMTHYVYEPLPPSLSLPMQQAQLRRMIELHVNPIEGLTSNWDYAEDRWKALREKEKGDWRMLCIEEKKALYRASFCQTYAEFQHPTGQWKAIVGLVFMCLSFPFWVMMFMSHFVFEPLPPSFALPAQKAQLRRMLELHVNPIEGLSSKWNYDEDRWK